MKIQALAISLHVSAEQSKNLFGLKLHVSAVSDRVDTSLSRIKEGRKRNPKGIIANPRGPYISLESKREEKGIPKRSSQTLLSLHLSRVKEGRKRNLKGIIANPRGPYISLESKREEQGIPKGSSQIPKGSFLFEYKCNFYVS